MGEGGGRKAGCRNELVSDWEKLVYGVVLTKGISNLLSKMYKKLKLYNWGKS
jgi:hypothetical protein